MEDKNIEFHRSEILNSYIKLVSRFVEVINLDKKNYIVSDMLGINDTNQEFNSRAINIFIGYISGKFEDKQNIIHIAIRIATGISAFNKSNYYKNNIIKPSYYNSFYGEIKNLEFDIKNL